MNKKLSIVNYQLSIFLVAVFFALPLKAQVNIGSDTTPQSFSILELTTSTLKGGLRLPQLTTDEISKLNTAGDDTAHGLVVYNTDTNCLEFWNGAAWISLCNYIFPAPPDPSTVTDDVPPTGFYPYVGAFWKSAQTGERLIRVTRPTTNVYLPLTPNQEAAVDGAWSAQVIAGMDWIVLDTLMTTDRNVGWRTDFTPIEANVANGNDVGFDNSYRVDGASTYVTGTMNASNPKIYFRIGLKGAIDSDAHRYGIVLLKYKDNTMSQRIWIRQGEEADYLMRNSDPVNSGGISERTACKQFSPYNLTANELNKQVGIKGADPNPGVFTQYPSQAGAFFQWATPTNIRFAYDPITTGIPTGITTWDRNSITGFWDSLGDNYETCPPDYRRPNDGSTGASVDGTDIRASEMRQSLWLNPQKNELSAVATESETANNVYGYYADGFFDRRKISAPYGVLGLTASSNPTSVSTGSYQVAHIGSLFYNTATNASLFFPLSGYRNGRITGSGGDLQDAGKGASYWASSRRTNTGDEWQQKQYIGISIMSSDRNSYGYSIRCVKN